VVFTDHDDFPRFEEQTADFTYARLQRSKEGLESGYEDAELDGWAAQARTWAKGDRDVFVFFTSGAKVRNPAAAQALMKRIKARQQRFRPPALPSGSAPPPPHPAAPRP
jgi:uncharacterized protein YecE (DUF72 family)